MRSRPAGKRQAVECHFGGFPILVVVGLHDRLALFPRRPTVCLTRQTCGGPCTVEDRIWCNRNEASFVPAGSLPRVSLQCLTSLDRMPASIVKARRRQIRFIRTSIVVSPRSMRRTVAPLCFRTISPRVQNGFVRVVKGGGSRWRI